MTPIYLVVTYESTLKRERRMILTGWFLVNIVGPMLLPVIGILPLRLLPLPASVDGLKLMTTVKDGQLCWAVIAMGSSTIFELWEALQAHKSVPAWGGLALGGVILVMLPAMLLAAGGAVFSTPLLSGSAGGVKAWMAHYRMFVGSAIMAVIAAFAYTNLHFSLPT
jgi:hypothetical protein